jgi:predicted tellurium resistance membrane protein TerC
MAFLFSLFTVVLSLCVVGLIVLALSSILGNVRDDWKLKKREREPRDQGEELKVQTERDRPKLVGKFNERRSGRRAVRSSR